MKKLELRFICLLGVAAVIAVFFPACAGPSISVKSSTGFTHETSVNIPFSPPDDSGASLYIDDEGTAVFIKSIEIYHGQVNPLIEYWLEIHKVDKHGTVETEKFGPFETIRSLNSDSNFIALENGNNVTCVLE